MSDLVKRLRDIYQLSAAKVYELSGEAADTIEQLERELAAEKALADQLYAAIQSAWIEYADDEAGINAAEADYLKARGL